MQTDALLPTLRGLIGTRILYREQACEVIEILEEGPMLVLQCANREQVIQANQYGDATRRAPKTISLPVLSDDGDDYHPEFRLLGLVNEG